MTGRIWSRFVRHLHRRLLRAATLLLVVPTLATATAVTTAVPAHAGYMGSTLTGGNVLWGGDYLLDSTSSYQLIMQGDGNLVLYYQGAALWATGTSGHNGAWVTMQTDGNLVIYLNGVALWSSHTAGYSGAYLVDQSDGNQVIYAGGAAIWNSVTAANLRRCWVPANCNTATFGYAFIDIAPQAPYTGAHGATTNANDYAMTKWAQKEGMPLSTGNPLATTQYEPCSTNWNSVGVKVYHNCNGQTYWYWGIVGNDQTVNNGLYNNILNALRNPVNGNYQQCVNLSNAVANSPWGTGSFASLC